MLEDNLNSISKLISGKFNLGKVVFKSFEDNIINLIISNNSQLSNFVELILSMELRKINNANLVFEAIAKGKTKFSDILGFFNKALSSAQLSQILNKLIEMDLINKTNGEFDIVSKDDKGYIVYEVKYKDEPIRKKDIKHLIEQLERCKVKYYKIGFFSKTGFKVSKDK